MGSFKHTSSKSSSKFATAQRKLARYKKKVADLEVYLAEARAKLKAGDGVIVSKEALNSKFVPPQKYRDGYIVFDVPQVKACVVYLPNLKRHLVVQRDDLLPDPGAKVFDLSNHGGYATYKEQHLVETPIWAGPFAESFQIAECQAYFPKTKENLVLIFGMKEYCIVKRDQFLSTPRTANEPKKGDEVYFETPSLPGYWLGTVVGHDEDDTRVAIRIENSRRRNQVFFVPKKSVFE